MVAAVLEVAGNLWDFHKQGHWVAITTNGCRTHTGEAVMGRGVALQAKQRFPALPAVLGTRLQAAGNRVYVFPEWHVITFPTKHDWKDQSDLHLIRVSAAELASAMASFQVVYLPRPGCANGGLLWKNVKPVIEPLLDDRFVVVYWKGERDGEAS
jgi:hypothetical protein